MRKDLATFRVVDRRETRTKTVYREVEGQVCQTRLTTDYYHTQVQSLAFEMVGAHHIQYAVMEPVCVGISDVVSSQCN